MDMALFLKTLYVIVALVFSVFYALKAAEIFEVPSEGKKCSWKFHQFWLNGLGSVVGWIALWFLLTKVISCFNGSCPSEINIWDALLFFASFIGVTGYLPTTVVTLINSVGALIGKVAGLPEPKQPPNKP